MPKVVKPWMSMQYDGTNGAYIAGTWCAGITFVSDTGSVLTFTGDNVTYTVDVGQWLVISGAYSYDPEVLTQAEYESRYVELP